MIRQTAPKKCTLPGDHIRAPGYAAPTEDIVPSLRTGVRSIPAKKHEKTQQRRRLSTVKRLDVQPVYGARSDD